MVALMSKAKIALPDELSLWFESKGYQPFDFQKMVWQEYSRGKNGLIYSSTGSGKTYAVLFAPIIEWLKKTTSKDSDSAQIIWITPLRALANDIANSIKDPIKEMGIPWQVEVRTGDTSSHRKKKQIARLPEILVTTPESLTMLLTYENTEERLKTLKLVVVDEWHELFGTKRGVQMELALARLSRWNKELRIWGLSATIGNPKEALDVLLSSVADQKKKVLIKNKERLNLSIKSIIPDEIELFPWAGHLNTALLPRVVDEIDRYNSTLLFTNTRFQAERWYQDILNYKEDLAGQLALHHGSLDQKKRRWVEHGLGKGILKCVICTSSLDLGVDFSPVDHVIQLGSPKGIARFLQRAGRSGHKPGLPSTVTFVPTNCLELIELSAAREAIEKSNLETKNPVVKPLDLLVQHLVTLSIGGGFQKHQLFSEIQTTYSYKNLTEDEWNWALDFVVNGGKSLGGYEEYRKIRIDQGKFKVSSPSIATRHRMSIGTITSDSSLILKYIKGPNIGLIEENFVSKLKPGDIFTFAGKVLELVRVKDMTVLVRRAKARRATPVRWMGGKMPLSSELASGVRERLAQAKEHKFRDQEMKAIKPILSLQLKLSDIPGKNELLIESVKTREGHHLFIYPFEGRMVHEGLSAILAYRISKQIPITFTIAVNDYGFELLSDESIEFSPKEIQKLFTKARLEQDILDSVNTIEMAKRHFREIARIAGIVFQGYPNMPKSTRQIQASSSLFFDVFKEYDPDNLLLFQARREVLSNQLEIRRLASALERISKSQIILKKLLNPSPLAFPLLVERLREKISSEKLEDRIKKMKIRYGKTE